MTHDQYSPRGSLPTQWPAGANVDQVIGYLLARHVPAPWLPYNGLDMIREATGWPTTHHRTALRHETSFRAGIDPALALSWLHQARQHARALGAPHDLPDLLSPLGDGTIRSHAAAIGFLQSRSSHDVADPTVLMDLASWCALPLPFHTTTIGARTGNSLQIYTASSTDLAHARNTARSVLRRWGVLPPEHLVADLDQLGISIDVAGDDDVLRRVLDILGTQLGVWPRRDLRTPVTRSLHRIANLNRPIPLAVVPDAVARCVTPRLPPIPGRWPVTVDALRAWAQASPSWNVDADAITPLASPRAPRRYDLAVMTAFSNHQSTLSWSGLRDALTRGGLTVYAAQSAIYWSPLIREVSGGYALLG